MLPNSITIKPYWDQKFEYPPHPSRHNLGIGQTCYAALTEFDFNKIQPSPLGFDQNPHRQTNSKSIIRLPNNNELYEIVILSKCDICPEMIEYTGKSLQRYNVWVQELKASITINAEQIKKPDQYRVIQFQQFTTDWKRSPYSPLSNRQIDGIAQYLFFGGRAMHSSAFLPYGNVS
jgi:hypothetical protein